MIDAHRFGQISIGRRLVYASALVRNEREFHKDRYFHRHPEQYGRALPDDSELNPAEDAYTGQAPSGVGMKPPPKKYPPGPNQVKRPHKPAIPSTYYEHLEKWKREGWPW